MKNKSSGKLARWLLVSLALGVSHWCRAETIRLYVGTDTGPNKGRGIYLTQLDTATGTLAPPQLAAESNNPTFLAFHPSGKFLFAANGVQRFNGKRVGSASSFSIDHATGKLTAINQASSGNAGPCHLSIDREGKNLLIANYSGGGFAVIPVDETGKLSEPSSVIQDDKSNPNQPPRGHCIQPDPSGKFVVGDDLGLDKIFVFRFDAAKGLLTANDPPAAQTPHGSGPRHIAFHPNGKWAYNIDETNSTMIASAWDSGKGVLTPLQTLSTLPADFHGKSTCAEVVVHPSGKFVYGSNRGHESIVIFKIDSVTGKLTATGYVPTGGKTPRSFAIDGSGRWLVAGNQDSGQVVAFKVNLDTGDLEPSRSPIEIPVPVCVMFGPQ